MSFEDNPGFKKLKDAFARFAANHDPNQLKPKLTKAATEAAKAALSEVEREFPKESVERLVNDVYQLLAGQDVTDGLSQLVQTLDLSQIEDGLNSVVDRLKDPQIGQSIASGFKSLSGQVSFIEFKTQMKFLLGNDKMPALVEGIFDRLMDDLEVFYDESKEMSVKEIADRLADYADSIPTDFVSQQIYGVMQYVNPETLTMVIAQLTTNLPSGKQAADLYGAGLDQARDKIDQLADKFAAQSQPKPAAPKNDNKPAPKQKKKKNDDGFNFGG